MNTILCPIDFSAGSENALEFAKAIAHRHQSKLLLVHFVSEKTNLLELSLSGFSDEKFENNLDEAYRNLHNMADAAKKEGVDCVAYNTVGEWEDLAGEVKAKFCPDLVVMGTDGADEHNPNGIMKKMDFLIHEIKVPILAVPVHSKYQSLSKIIYGTDFAYTDFDSIQNLIDITAPYSPEITLLHIAKDQKAVSNDQEVMKIFSAVEERFTHYPSMKYRLVQASDVPTALTVYAESEEAEWISVSTRNRTFIDNWFSHGNTHKLVHKHKMPLLIFHMHKYDSDYKF